MSQPSWLAQLDAVQQAHVHGLIDAASRVDGVAPVSEQVVLALRSAAAAEGHPQHLLAASGETVTGYASLTAAPPVAELVVHPERRRQGIGATLAAEVLRAGGDELRLWAHGNGVAARGLAEKLGLVSRRELWQMRVDLTAVELPPVQAPAGIRLRTYVPAADDAAVLAVNNAAFAWHPEQGGWGEQELAQRRAEPWFDAEGFFLAVSDSGELRGFHWTKVHEPEDGRPALGEVYVVGVAPDAQGSGLGRVLTLAGLHYLRSRGLRTVLLYVEGDNAAAVHTYTKLGFTRYHVDVAYGR
ncbi:MAG: mycothiol synthase [Mycobacteriaceae bacterium]